MPAFQDGEPTTSTAPRKQQVGLDKVLEELQGPKTISTVAKSSIDWENFKEAEGLEDELLKAQKDGYLHRKEFLERCDVREFEQEKTARTRGQN